MSALLHIDFQMFFIIMVLFSEKELGKNTVKKDILDKYGGAEHLQMPSRDVLVSQAETYVEFAPDGRVVKGQEIAIPKSKYLEDGMKQMIIYWRVSITGQSIDRNLHWFFRVLSVVLCQHSFAFLLCYVFLLGLSSFRFTTPVLEGNHSTVYGSYWEQGQWGYACCHLFYRNAYCLGKATSEKTSSSMSVASSASLAASSTITDQDYSAVASNHHSDHVTTSASMASTDHSAKIAVSVAGQVRVNMFV